MSDDITTEEEKEEKKEENIIKKVCREYNLTYKELATEIGYAETSLRSLGVKSNDDITLMLKKALEMFTRIKQYEKEEEEISIVKKWIRSVAS